MNASDLFYLKNDAIKNRGELKCITYANIKQKTCALFSLGASITKEKIDWTEYFILQ